MPNVGDVISASMPGPEMRFLPLGMEQLLFLFPIYVALYFRLFRRSEEPKGVSIFLSIRFLQSLLLITRRYLCMARWVAYPHL